MQKINFLSFVFIIDKNPEILVNKIKEIDLMKLKKQYEIVIMDNGLNEFDKKKLYILRNKVKNLRIITLAKKYNFDTALIAALDNSIGDGILILNYLNDNSTTIKNLLRLLAKGNDIVVTKNLKNLSKIKLPLRLFLLAINKLSSKLPFVNLTNTLALNRKAVNSITKIRKKNRNFSYLQDSLGLKVKYFDNKLSETFISEFNKTKPHNLVLKIINTIVSNSIKPLRLVTYFSVLASFLSLLFIFYVFLVSLIKKNIVEGWISTTLVIGIMFFMLFLILSVLSEYILRILEEVAEEPLYFIEKEIDHSILIANKRLNIYEKMK
ncbi:MAG: glycosyltransferase family 2 protein [Candidatus Microgenomates bacterium]